MSALICQNVGLYLMPQCFTHINRMIQKEINLSFVKAWTIFKQILFGKESMYFLTFIY
jgi:hypothetical protein